MIPRPKTYLQNKRWNDEAENIQAGPVLTNDQKITKLALAIKDYTDNGYEVPQEMLDKLEQLQNEQV